MRIEHLFAADSELIDNRARPSGCIYNFARDNWWLVVHEEPDLDMEICHVGRRAQFYRLIVSPHHLGRSA